ncbi:beta-agarase [Dyella psychrodurans]|uniref:Beta-agarase n=1 Tax=Dyella psychrodurans TaxID=1927960 RepID=A0A370X4J4_9GAMM|nr:beta-agarase [Dyella psychrodurans]RDS83339.1 beta-agarase [Dyella psychrodurans]
MKRVALFVTLALCASPFDHAAAVEVTDLSTATSGTQIQLLQVERVGSTEHDSRGTALQRYAFQPSSQPQLVITPTNGMWNWSGQGALQIDVQNAMAWAVTLVVDIDGAAPNQHLHAVVGLPAGPAQTLVVPLHDASPRSFGMQVGPLMPFDDHGRDVFVATKVEGAIDPAQIRAIHLSMSAPQAVQQLLLGKVDTAVGDASLQDAYRGIVDQWGQYTRGKWPEKVGSDAVLRAGHMQEQHTLNAEMAERHGLDVYGGRQDIALTRTGWFHTQKAKGRWWLVTPDGHAFFSLGVNAVAADNSRTYVQGREYMFVNLPLDEAPWHTFYGLSDSRDAERVASMGLGANRGRWFDFYEANLYRASGADWLTIWRRRALDRLQAWGFNTIGNWSDDALGKMHRVAYTLPIYIDGTFGNVSSGFDYWGRMPDPFDPRFARAVEQAVANATENGRKDPWLLGYFADNELAWAGFGPQGRWNLAMGTLRGEARSDAKQAFIAMLKKKYGEPAKFAAAWGIALADWSALNATNFAAPEPGDAHPAIAEDYSAWLRMYADKYFSTVAAAIHRHDSHHLFLGGRFAVNTPEAVASCAQYCDVISFNLYADVPQHGVDLDAVHKLDKPVLITEFHFGSDDRGPFGKGVVSVWNEAQRGEAYARFVQAAASDPAIVGTHWFEYADQPVTGRLIDGENSHIGLVGITDLPFGGFVEAVRKANLGLSH